MLRPPVVPMRVVAVQRLPEPNRCRGGCRYEPKFDGWRAIAFVEADRVFLQSRSGKALHAYFPDVVAQLAAAVAPGTVIDGELVVWDPAAGRTSFTALQRRVVAGRRLADLVAAYPAHLVCFDLLQLTGTVLLDRPLVRRRAELESLLAGTPATLQLCPHTDDIEQARRWMSELAVTGVEGVVVKGAATVYRPGQPGWSKVKTRTTTEAIIAGVTGTLAEPVALLLGRLDQAGRLRYVARTHRLGAAARSQVAAALPPWPAVDHPWPQPLPAGWVGPFGQPEPVVYTPVEPRLVAEIEVDPAMEGGWWRHTVRLVRLRADLTITEVPPFVQYDTRESHA